MTTYQIIGIAIAGGIVVLLLVALVATRRREVPTDEQLPQEPPDVTPETTSVFADAPRDELSSLAQDRRPVEAVAKRQAVAVEVAPEPEIEPAAEPPRPAEPPLPAEQPEPASQQAEESAAGELTVADLWARPRPEEAVAQPAGIGAGAVAADVTGEPEPAAAIEDVAGEPEQVAATADVAGGSEPEAAPADVADRSEPEATTTASGASSIDGPNLISLSSVLTTTNDQQIDLGDPEVRRMLQDLVDNELGLADQYAEAGQNVDAILQLSEAKRICDALGMTSRSESIRERLEQLGA